MNLQNKSIIFAFKNQIILDVRRPKNMYLKVFFFLNKIGIAKLIVQALSSLSYIILFRLF